MKKTQAIAALAALAQENRLDTFRLLVQAGPGGMPAGEVAERLGISPNTLTFHFDRLREAGLVSVRREGRSMIYAARYETMNGAARLTSPRIAAPASPNARLPPALRNCRHAKRARRRCPHECRQSHIARRRHRGGPVGLAAAAHLVTRGVPVKLYEAGETVAANVRDWAHVRLFSPWRFNTDAAATAILREHGWQAPLPTRCRPAAISMRPISSRSLKHRRCAPSSKPARACATCRAQGIDKVVSRGRGDHPFALDDRRSGRSLAHRSCARRHRRIRNMDKPKSCSARPALPAVGEITFADRIAYGIPDVLGRDRHAYAAVACCNRRRAFGRKRAARSRALAETDRRMQIIWAVRAANLDARVRRRRGRQAGRARQAWRRSQGSSWKAGGCNSYCASPSSGLNAMATALHGAERATSDARTLARLTASWSAPASVPISR